MRELPRLLRGFPCRRPAAWLPGCSLSYRLPAACMPAVDVPRLPLPCRVTELRPRTPALQLEQFFVSWAAQPSFSLAIHTLGHEELSAAAAAAAMGGRQQQRLGSGGGAAGSRVQRLQGLAVHWAPQQAFYLELSGALTKAALLPVGQEGRLSMGQAAGTRETHSS